MLHIGARAIVSLRVSLRVSAKEVSFHVLIVIVFFVIVILLTGCDSIAVLNILCPMRMVNCKPRDCAKSIVTQIVKGDRIVTVQGIVDGL